MCYCVELSIKLVKRLETKNGVATDYMTQGELVVIPLSKNSGYQNVTHIMAHFEGADPDLGRKGFQPELVQLAQKISVRITNNFMKWRKHLKNETGAPPNIAEHKKIYDWIKEQEEHEKNYPLKINRKDIFLPSMEPSLTSIPLVEQDLIALFNQLLAGGVIRGIKLMASSQHQQYDGVFRYIMQKPYSIHTFDINTNPLGVDQSNIIDEYLSAPKILEYKYSVDALIEEFEKGIKTEKQIDLVIAWSMGGKWEERYEITTSLLLLDNLQHRFFHGGTHIIKNGTTGEAVLNAIILSELIEYINDPDAVQVYQKELYSD